MSLTGKAWKILNEEENKSFLDKIFFNRNLKTPEEIDNFLNPDLEKESHDPFLMKDIDKALDRIKVAIKKKERIVVFGDYDVDGVSGTAILIYILSALGANFSWRLPNRMTDGYGLSPKFINKFEELDVKLIITVDTGISCKHEINLAKEKGIDTIITDHHTIPVNFPDQAIAIIHPQQESCNYPFEKLAGAGVALKLAEALAIKFLPEEKQEPLLKTLVSFATLGTVADCVPLKGENRILVKKGLSYMKNPTCAGLRLLKRKAGLEDGDPVTTFNVGFYLGPRINAAGRMSDPHIALLLFLKKEEEAALIADKLESLNRERQEITQVAMEQAEEILGDKKDKEKILIAYHKEWHTGIVGLIAGKISEKYSRPSLIMEDRGDTLVGSGRSPGNLNIVEAITAAKEFLEEYGGHAGAAGFSLKKENLASFIAKIVEYTDQRLDFKDLSPVQIIDCEVAPKELNIENYQILQKMEPFGIENPIPTLLVKNVHLKHIKQVGREGSHLKFLADFGIFKMEGIAFRLGNLAEKIDPSQKYDIVCQLDLNEWNGNKKLQLKVVDIG